MRWLASRNGPLLIETITTGNRRVPGLPPGEVGLDSS